MGSMYAEKSFFNEDYASLRRMELIFWPFPDGLIGKLSLATRDGAVDRP